MSEFEHTKKIEWILRESCLLFLLVSTTFNLSATKSDSLTFGDHADPRSDYTEHAVWSWSYTVWYGDSFLYNKFKILFFELLVWCWMFHLFSNIKVKGLFYVQITLTRFTLTSSKSRFAATYIWPYTQSTILAAHCTLTCKIVDQWKYLFIDARKCICAMSFIYVVQHLYFEVTL